MKNQSSWWKLLPVAVLAVSSCQKKETPQVQEKAASVAEDSELPKIKALSPEERANMLGFAQHLSKDVDSVIALYDGNQWAAKVKSLKAWKILLNTMSEQTGENSEEQIAQVGDMLSKYLGQEFFIAVGKGTADQVHNLVTYSQRRNYYQFLSLTRAFADKKDGGMKAFNSADKEMLKHLGDEIGWIQTLQMPPLLIGAKVTDEQAMTQAKQALGQYLAMLPQFMADAVEPIEFTKAGASFSGMKLKGQSLAGFIEMARPQLAEQNLKPEDIDKLIEAAKKRNLVIAYGTLGQELLIYLGDDAESCPLVEKVGDSLCANGDVAGVDEWAGKTLGSFTYATSALARSGQAGAFAQMAAGIQDGLKDAKIEGSQELVDQLNVLVQKEKDLLSLYTYSSGVSVSYFEDGLKLESTGGVDMHMVDSKQKHQLEKLKDSEGVIYFADSVLDPQFTEKAYGYVEAIAKTAYIGASKASALEGIESSGFAQFQQGFKMFDQNFRPDFLSIYQSLKAMDQGLGTESAAIIDTKGTLPPVPGIPQVLVDQGKFFRASTISPVKDRAKLAASWDEIDKSLRNIFSKASEISGNQIAMQKPISSEKGDFTTWFYSFPFFTNDFTPSVTVSDKWLILSTAKSQAIELGLAADKAAGNTKGSYAEFRVEPLVKFTRDWLALVDQNSAKVIPDEEARQKFTEAMPTALKALDAMEDLKKITIHQRIERDQLRTSVHLSTN
jgi:hypothetical protein